MRFPGHAKPWRPPRWRRAWTADFGTPTRRCLGAHVSLWSRLCVPAFSRLAPFARTTYPGQSRRARGALSIAVVSPCNTVPAPSPRGAAGEAPL